MNLHRNYKEFKEAIFALSERLQISSAIIEKDY